MAWNGAYSAARIRAWLDAHPESRYLLGFNEPNFYDQARMTPAEAPLHGQPSKALPPSMA